MSWDIYGHELRPDQPQWVQPSREDVVAALKGVWFNLSDEFLGRFADAALALFAQQPTVAEVKAEALREAERELDQWMMRWKPGGWGSNPADQQTLALAADSLRWMRTRADRIEREARP